MQEHARLQQIPVRMFRAGGRLTVAAPMPGLEPEDISVEVTGEGRLVLVGKLRGEFKDNTDVLLNEWSAGAYHRELELPEKVDGEMANVTYGNGVLVVVLPIAAQTRPAHLELEDVGRMRGQHIGHAGSTIEPHSTEEHQAAITQQQASQR